MKASFLMLIIIYRVMTKNRIKAYGKSVTGIWGMNYEQQC